MAYVAVNPHAWNGKVIDDGHCVAHVREVCKAPHTSAWKQGVKAKDANYILGCAVATFDPDGSYGNHTDGRSHAAVLLYITQQGLQVMDQWQGQPVHERTIRFKDGDGLPVDDGDAFYIVE